MVPILRAGLGMLDGVLDMIPSAKVSVVGLSRNHETLQPENYFEKFVGKLDERTALIIDPMLATAGSMIATISLLKARGCKDIRALVLVAAPEGVAALDKSHPDVRCWTGCHRQPPERNRLHHPRPRRCGRQDLRHEVAAQAMSAKPSLPNSASEGTLPSVMTA